MQKIRVTIWNEFHHEREEPEIQAIYPDGIHMAIADFLKKLDEENMLELRTAVLDDAACGLPDTLLNETDVLIWWAHMAHDDVPDALAEKIRRRVYEDGMGFIALHSAHYSKPFRLIVGASGYLLAGLNQKEILWNINPAHPIAAGIGEYTELGMEEMYGEPFGIPRPDELVFAGWFEHGYVFRSGCCWNRGAGRVFYFQPGHEECPMYYQPTVQKIISNAVRWAAPSPDMGYSMKDCHWRDPIV